MTRSCIDKHWKIPMLSVEILAKQSTAFPTSYPVRDASTFLFVLAYMENAMILSKQVVNART